MVMFVVKPVRPGGIQQACGGSVGITVGNVIHFLTKAQSMWPLDSCDAWMISIWYLVLLPSSGGKWEGYFFNRMNSLVQEGLIKNISFFCFCQLKFCVFGHICLSVKSSQVGLECNPKICNDFFRKMCALRLISHQLYWVVIISVYESAAV